MTKLVTIRGVFKDKSHYQNQSPESVDFYYSEDGKPLSAGDAIKMNEITKFYLDNEIYPDFLAEEKITDETRDFAAEVELNLSSWSNGGLPLFTMKDIQTGKPSNLPCGNNGGRPKKQTKNLPETSEVI